jgi:hypothetical protein
MQESNHIITEYANEDPIYLEMVTSLSVYNNGAVVVFINGVGIYPNQKEILVVPDGTFSSLKLEPIFVGKDQPIKKFSASAVTHSVRNNPIPAGGIDGDAVPVIAPAQKFLIIYKKLK